ncbi:MAG: excinuclease ABC subunit UvrC [Thermodesulfobacteriota bacterium]|nr:MAG: excinuclease ABC subunit UvrC [Thermodesulfobacteriota bacterium]
MTEKKIKKEPESPAAGRPLIEGQLKNLPTLPGVYLMKGRGGGVLYIGKAKNLKARVRSYFRAAGDGRYAVKFLASRTEEIDYIITGNEKEALLLEDTLLKQYKPKYNIRLKDSKTYVSIKITTGEKFPRILVTRQIKKDGSRYFGPYISARSVRGTIKLIRRIFPLCAGSISAFRNRTRPCLDYQLGLCSGPAAGLITERAYRELVGGAVMFLEGKNAELLKILKRKMKDAAQRLDFEKAARMRDQISSIEEMLEKQTVVSHRAVDRDVFGLARGSGVVSIQVVFVRGGRISNSFCYTFHDTGLPSEALLSSFLTQFYRADRFIPGELLLTLRPEDPELIEGWLGERGKKKVTLRVPSRGDKLKLVQLAEKNAAESIRKKTKKETLEEEAAMALMKRLRLKKPPRRIEAFDISNISGMLAVGAVVTFKNGVPDKSGYRLFKIRGVEGPDDYAMMHEVISRRYSKTPAEAMPDLIIVDGGKGQLGVALKVLDALALKGGVDVGGIDVAALAKDKPEDEPRRPVGAKKASKGERVYLPNVKDPVLLKEGTAPDLLLRRIRDEVHRFAITYQRKLRKKEGITSILDSVEGIGEKRKKALYKRFGDMQGVLGAGIKELMAIPGITEKTAEAIKALKQGR